MNFLEKFESHLKQTALIRPGEKVLVACSGGPDSTALFHLLKSLPASWKLKISLIHFNHQLRGRASQGDEQFVRNLARRFKVPFLVQRGNVKQLAAKEKFSVEEAARAARYGFFQKAAAGKKGVKIAMAHTQEDQAETVLMRFLQGTGLKGLCGIRETYRQGNAVFIRPLLVFSKKEILAYLKAQKVSFRRDASNLSERYLRNRIRLKLIPLLEKEFNPRVVEALARVPASLTGEAEILSGLEEKAWKNIFLRQKSVQIFFQRKKFLELPAALQFRLLERGLRRLDPKAGIGFEAWHTLKGGLSKSRLRYSLPKDIDFVLTPTKIMLYKKSPTPSNRLAKLGKGDRL
jgi:tRNA(Ile)-lysidine synthase